MIAVICYNVSTFREIKRNTHPVGLVFHARSVDAVRGQNLTGVMIIPDWGDYPPQDIDNTVRYLQTAKPELFSEDHIRTTEQKVRRWASQKNLLNLNNIPKQALKMCAEAGEVADAIAKGDVDNTKMEIGDVMVTLTILAAQHGWTIEDCFKAAYNKIAARKGRTIDGVFVKEEDLA